MKLVKKIATVASGVMISRFFGFIREMLIAISLGTSLVADVFNIAFRFPNTFRRLFAEGVFNSAFVPLFASQIEKDTDSARQFSDEVFGALFFILLLLTIIMEFSMPFLVAYVIAPGFAGDALKLEATIRFAAIMFPYLACMSLAAMMGSILTVLRRYFAASIAPVFLNVILISILVYAWFFKLDVWHIGLSLAWGVMAAGIIQLLIVWIAVHNAGIKISLILPRLTANVRRLLVLVLPAIVTGGITQINLLINTNIASAETGAVSSLVYADRLHQLPLSVIGISASSVLLSELTHALRSGNWAAADNLQSRSIEFILLLSIPAAAAFLVMSEPIVRLLFEYGQFDAQSTVAVSGILAIYGLGLPAFVLVKAFIPIFFARKDTKTPMIFAVISVFVNVSLAVTLFPYLSAKGIAIAEVIAGWTNAALLFLTLIRRAHWKGYYVLIKRIPIFLTSAVIMAIILLLSIDFFAYPLSGKASLAAQVSCVGFLIFGSMGIYFALIFLTSSANLTAAKKLVYGIHERLFSDKN